MNEVLLQQLLDAGTPPLLVAKVAAEMATLAAKADAAAELIEKRRAKDRERKRDAAPRNSTETTECAETLAPSLSLPPDPQPNPTPTPENNKPTRVRAAWACPEGVNPDHWRDFLANRRRKKCAVTETAYAAILRDLRHFAEPDWPPGRLVQTAAERGWASLVDPKEMDHGHRNSHRQPHSDPTVGKNVAARDAVLARLALDGGSAEADPRPGW